MQGGESSLYPCILLKIRESAQKWKMYSSLASVSNFHKKLESDHFGHFGSSRVSKTVQWTLAPHMVSIFDKHSGEYMFMYAPWIVPVEFCRLNLTRVRC